MSQFYDQASLVMVPSGYKDGKLYSQKPLSTSGELTFSRGSDIEATRIGADGLIQKAQVNLLLQSNQFDTTWVPSSASVTSGQSGYDGTSDAWLLDSSAGYLYQSISATGVHTISVYVKAGTAEGFRIRVDQATDANYIIDLSDGSLISQSDNIAYKSTSVGGGWYRMEMAFLANTITNIQFRITDLAGATASGTAYIQDAQLNYGLVAQDYVETTTTSVVAGITNDMPRLDYSGGASCPSLLLEPSRQNLVTNSEYASGNSKTGSPTITENYAISPEGVQNAFRLQDTDGSSFKTIRLSSSLSVSANSTHTSSVFVKKAASAVSTYGGFGFDYNGGTRQISYIIFDEYNGTLTAIQSQSTTTLHDVEDFGDYWRFSVTATDTGSNTTLTASVYACLSSNGTGASTGIKDWTGYGLQLEAGSYPTSYIPNYGLTSGVTRTADACSKTGIASLIGQSEGVLFADFIMPPSGTLFTHYRISGTGGLYNNSQSITLTATNQVRGYSFSAGGVQAQIDSGTYAEGTRVKVAYAYKANDFVLYVNGVQIGTDTSGTVPAMSELLVGSYYPDTSLNVVNKTNQVLLFTQRLSNSDLATLTSL